MPATTAKVPGEGAGTLSYTIPGDGLDLESVYAVIDNSAGGSAVTAELTLQDQSGVVIARKKQGATIPAGGSGSATWALRLDDEATAAPSGSGIQFDTYPQAGTWLYVEVNGSIDATTYAAIAALFPGVPPGLSELLIDSGGGGIMLYEPYAGPLTLKNDGGRTTIDSYQTYIVGFAFDVHVTNGLLLDGASGGIVVDGHDGNISLNVNGHAFGHTNLAHIDLSIEQTGDKVAVIGPGGAPIFEVWGDGSIHGQAAVGAITWDL